MDFVFDGMVCSVNTVQHICKFPSFVKKKNEEYMVLSFRVRNSIGVLF